MGRQLVEHRLCLERDVAAGIVPVAGFAAVDGVFGELSTLLEAARVELEAAGPAALEPGFVVPFVGGCGALDRQMFSAMYGELDPVRLGQLAAELRAEGRALLESLRARVRRVAA
jgi:hypothetical protein